MRNLAVSELLILDVVRGKKMEATQVTAREAPPRSGGLPELQIPMCQ
jgi:hypothetical protein